MISQTNPSPVGHRRFKYPAPVAPLVGVHHVLEAFVVAKGLNRVTKFEYGIVFVYGWAKHVPGNKLKELKACVAHPKTYFGFVCD